MSNQNQLIRRMVTVLLACCLIPGLLPGFAAAQDLSIQEERAAYLFAQYWPDETGWMRGTHSSEQLMMEARKNLLALMPGGSGVSRAKSTTCNPVPIGNARLVGWWKLDEKSGTIVSDSSGCGNHGKLIGGPTWVSGRIGGALHFANTDNTKIYVDIPNSPTLENVQERDYTIAAWVWPDHLPPGTEVTPAYGIVVKQGAHIGLVYDQDGLFKMQHHSSAGYNLAKSAKKPPMAWYHVTGIVSKSNGFVKIYVNGKHEATVKFTPGATAREFGTETWKLGIAGPEYIKFREAMNGKIDDVRIYSGVLSDRDIAALAAQGDSR